MALSSMFQTRQAAMSRFVRDVEGAIVCLCKAQGAWRELMEELKEK